MRQKRRKKHEIKDGDKPQEDMRRGRKVAGGFKLTPRFQSSPSNRCWLPKVSGEISTVWEGGGQFPAVFLVSRSNPSPRPQTSEPDSSIHRDLVTGGAAATCPYV